MQPTGRCSSARVRRPSTGRTAIRPRSCWSRLLDPDPEAVTEQQRPGLLSEHFPRHLTRSVEQFADFRRLFEQPAGTADAVREADQSLGVGIPPAVGDELTQVAKAPAAAHLVEM